MIRPRSSPLLKTVQTAGGEQQICTFSHDQVGFLNFKNPEVLYAFIRLLKFLVGKGVKHFRLDAIAFLWKESGTPCVHLKETHEVVKLIRLILEQLNPESVLITETNVPNRENLSYFGNDNEAHLIYNFSLPPLLIYALLKGDSDAFKNLDDVDATRSKGSELSEFHRFARWDWLASFRGLSLASGSSGYARDTTVLCGTISNR